MRRVVSGSCEALGDERRECVVDQEPQPARRPRMQGTPPIWSGRTVIRVKFIASPRSRWPSAYSRTADTTIVRPARGATSGRIAARVSSWIARASKASWAAGRASAAGRRGRSRGARVADGGRRDDDVAGFQRGCSSSSGAICRGSGRAGRTRRGGGGAGLFFDERGPQAVGMAALRQRTGTRGTLIAALRPEARRVASARPARTRGSPCARSVRAPARARRLPRRACR